jgi:hypothetical protein
MDFYIMVGVIAVIMFVAAFLMLKSLNHLILKDDMLSKIGRSIDVQLSKTQAVYCKELYSYSELGQNLNRVGVVLSSMIINFSDGKTYVIFNVKTQPLYFGFFEIIKRVFQFKRNFIYVVVDFNKCRFNQKICFVEVKSFEEFNVLDMTYFYEPADEELIDSIIVNEFQDIQLLEYYKQVSRNEIDGLRLKNSKHFNMQKEQKI